MSVFRNQPVKPAIGSAFILDEGRGLENVEADFEPAGAKIMHNGVAVEVRPLAFEIDHAERVQQCAASLLKHAVSGFAAGSARDRMPLPEAGELVAWAWEMAEHYQQEAKNRLRDARMDAAARRMKEKQKS